MRVNVPLPWSSPSIFHPPDEKFRLRLTDYEVFNRYTYVLNDPVNGVDPFGLCVRDADGNPLAGLCAAPGDETAEQYVKDQLKDEDSLASDVDAAATAAGVIVTVVYKGSGSSKWSPSNPDKGAPTGGTITIGGDITIVTGVDDSGNLITTIEGNIFGFEHELSHAIDWVRDGMTRLDGLVEGIEAGQGDAYTPFIDPGEERAINRTNRYRKSKKKSYQRICYTKNSCVPVGG